MTTIDSSVLVMTRVFDAPRERVFDAWMDRDEFEAWIGLEGMTCNVTRFEPRVGGHYCFVMNLDDGRKLPVAGIFKSIDRPAGLSMTWAIEGSTSQATLVTVTLRDVGGKTQLTLTHAGFSTPEDRDGHDRGWKSTLNKLASYVAEGA